MSNMQLASQPQFRETQFRLLRLLAQRYPSALQLSDIQKVLPAAYSNLEYLFEIGMVRKATATDFSGNVAYAITAKGLDFFAMDGGPEAILKVGEKITTSETVLELLQQKIEASELQHSQKVEFMQRIHSLNVIAANELALQIIEAR